MRRSWRSTRPRVPAGGRRRGRGGGWRAAGEVARRGAQEVGDVAAVRDAARERLGAQAACQGQRQAEAEATLGLFGVAPAPRAQLGVVAGLWRPVGHQRPPRPLSGPVVVVLS